MNFRFLPLGFALLVAPAVQAQSFANTAMNSSIGVFGSSSTGAATPTYGQTFNVSSSAVLDSWTFWVEGGAGAGNLSFHIATWGASSDCSGASAHCSNGRASSSLFDTTLTYSGGNYEALTVSNIGLSLGAGSYVAYMTVAGVQSPVTSLSFVEGNGNATIGGDFVYDHAYQPDGQGNYTAENPLSHTRAWSLYRDQDNLYYRDLQFAATFNPSPVTTPISAIPEPETYAMMLAGLALTGWAARRRRGAKAVVL